MIPSYKMDKLQKKQMKKQQKMQKKMQKNQMKHGQHLIIPGATPGQYTPYASIIPQNQYGAQHIANSQYQVQQSQPYIPLNMAYPPQQQYPQGTQNYVQMQPQSTSYPNQQPYLHNQQPNFARQPYILNQQPSNVNYPNQQPYMANVPYQQTSGMNYQTNQQPPIPTYSNTQQPPNMMSRQPNMPANLRSNQNANFLSPFNSRDAL